jgi:HEAT repeat protein
VNETISSLLGIIEKGEEDDVTWAATDAVGKLQDPQKAPGVLTVLLKAANTPPPVGTQDEAPQLRYEALGAIVELAKQNNLKVVSELEKLLHESQHPQKKHVAEAILKLDSTNEAARAVVGPDKAK